MNKCQVSGVKYQAYKRILIVRMDRLGDVVLSTPAIKAVRDAYPDSYIACVVRPYASSILAGNPHINEVVTYDKSKNQKGFWGNIRFILNLRKKKFDLAIILHPKNSSHLLSYLAGIPTRIGYDKKLGFLLTIKVPHTKQFGLRHEIDYNLELLRYIGIESHNRGLCVPRSETSDAKIEDIFRRNGILQKDSVITIHPGASCPSRRWKPDRYAKVADILSKNYNARIVIIAGPDDVEFGNNVAILMQTGSLNLSGKTRIEDLVSILKRSKLFISNDSGPVHIACAVGTPTISIFGRSDPGLSPRRWGPVGSKDIAIHKDVGCDICLAHKCKRSFKCLDAISVEEVVKAADKILGE